jgi:uncharacterized protein YbjT (DUF2867 family)
MNSPRPLTVLVTGGTGRQGGALTRELLARGHKVRVLTRQPHRPAADALRALGADMVAGDFADRASLDRAMHGLDAAFVTTTPFELGPSAETRHGIALVDAAKAAHLRHFVYCSVASADKSTGIPHFESKHRVEQHLAASDVPFTVLGPVCFMECALAPSPSDLAGGWTNMELPADRAVQRIALANLAAFATMVLEERDRFLGKRLDLASDAVSRALATEILGPAAPRPIDDAPVVPLRVREMRADVTRMVEWLNSTGFNADIAGLKRHYPQIGWLSFRAWAATQPPPPPREG